MGNIFVTTTGNLRVITNEHMLAMPNEAIVCNIGHFDSEIDIASLRQYTWENIKPQVDHVIFPDGKRIIILSAAFFFLFYFLYLLRKRDVISI